MVKKFTRLFPGFSGRLAPFSTSRSVNLTFAEGFLRVLILLEQD